MQEAFHHNVWTPRCNFSKIISRWLGSVHWGDILGQSIIGQVHKEHSVNRCSFLRVLETASKIDVSPEALLVHRDHFLRHWMTDRGNSDLSSSFSSMVTRVNFSQPSPSNPFIRELGLQHRSYRRGEPSLLHLRNDHVGVKGAKRMNHQRRGALTNFLLPQSLQA